MTKSSRRKPVLWVMATVACAAVAFSAGQLPVNPGEKILNTACTSCHDLRPIETTALDGEGWTKIIEAMVEKGADVKKDDVPVLVRYLGNTYGPLPDCLLYTSDAADERSSVDLGGRRI